MALRRGGKPAYHRGRIAAARRGMQVARCNWRRAPPLADALRNAGSCRRPIGWLTRHLGRASQSLPEVLRDGDRLECRPLTVDPETGKAPALVKPRARVL